MCWNPSWQRRLARLLRSDLDLIKAAVSAHVVPLTRALDAPGKVSPAEQRHWIERLVAQVEPRTVGPGAAGKRDERCERLAGAAADTVRRGRRLTRLLVGRRLPDRAADRQMRAWHEQGAIPSDLIAQARSPRPKPDPSDASWPAGVDDPATVLLGPWSDPVDLEDALERADALMATRNKRRLALGRVLDRIARCWNFLDWGFERFADWVEQDLDMSVRSAYRVRAEGREFDARPDLARAVDQGLPTERATAIARLADSTEDTLRWLTVAAHLPTRELMRASCNRKHRVARRDRYEALIQDAPALVRRALEQRRQRLDPDRLTETAADSTGLAGWTANTTPLGPDMDSPDADRNIRVALRASVDEASRGPVLVERGVLDAARWLLETVEIPAARGIGRIRERADHTCANPECRHRSLRVQVHHVIPRALGGTDDADNLRCLCPSCHLRLVHGGFMAIEPVGDADVFLYPGRAVVVR
ncbi:MAG: HNH endonuclease [Deltaproteobacteria bacterium]|nr:MAG: HNH endonuclease [Deltaproteobacteria bacterium]